MTVNPRRPAFRMPWSADSQPDEEQKAPQAESGASADDAAHEAQIPTAAPAADADDVTGDAASEAPASSGDMTADAAGPDAAAAVDVATTGEESGEFLRSLVDAMRGVAETSRDTSIAELRDAVDSRISALQARGAENADDLRRRADLDINGIGEWERSEAERIRDEAERKRADRREALERELTESRTATEAQVEATRRRLADHETKLGAFFEELAGITDPATFVVAAKRMPQAPELTDELPASPSSTGGSATPDAGVAATSDPRLAALGVTEPGEAEDATVSTEPQAAAGAVGETAAPATSEHDDALARRLAQLDARLAGTEGATSGESSTTNGTAADASDAADADPAEAGTVEPDAAAATSEPVATEPAASEPVATPAATPSTASAGSDASTAIVVKGLGSFGAITSFKQALERVDGVRGVTLSLGPTGEFVYRASHASDFDLEGAIRSIEGDAANIERNDGSYQVTVSRGR